MDRPPVTISLIVIASGPERLVARAREIADRLTGPSTELVMVPEAAGMTPGAARNAGVRRSTGEVLLVIDGSETLPPDYVASAQRALDAAPDAAFAAAPGGALFGMVNAGQGEGGWGKGACIDAGTLAGSAWAVGPAVIRRHAFDAIGGFDETLPALVDWDVLLSVADAGMTGVMIAGRGTRHADDDVRLRESLATPNHLPAIRHIFDRHRRTFESAMRAALVERERTVKALFEYERGLLQRRRDTLAELNATVEQIDTLKPELGRHGLRTLDFGDLRRTSPVSRNWGSERGRPVDRHYIHRFLADHAGDVRGHVLEMLDAGLTTTYGAERVERSDVLDIDPGNARATLVADLRMAEHLPADVYDCFILTQTLHLIDDMPSALQTAYRLLKPGGVLLATLPCASMVAEEYGAKGDHWRVTEAGARSLFERVFHPADVAVRSHGNVLTLTAFLYGLSCDDLDAGEFADDDPAYPLLVTVRAHKPATAARAAVRARSTPTAAVLLYHRVADLAHDTHALAVSPRAFRSQVEQLRASWQVLPLRALAQAVANGEPPERGIALTFDDGYLDNLEVAAPILAELGLPATFFLSPESLAACRRYWWEVLEELRVRGHASQPQVDEWYATLKASPPVVRDDLLRQLVRDTPVTLGAGADRPMVGDEVRRLREFPLIEVGAHGLHHRSLPLLSAEDCHREVFESRSALERVIGRPVTTFAYPFGDVSPDAVTTVMAAGFECAVSCEERGLRPREHRLRIPRLPTREESGAELDARLAQALTTPGSRRTPRSCP